MASSAGPPASPSSRSHGNAAGAGSATAMMLPGPPGRGNGGCIDLSPAGLLAHGAGSSVVVSDPRSMQLLCVLPMPSSALASFVTAVRWAPPAAAPCSLAGNDDDDDGRPLRLAAGDRHGRIAVWDARARAVLCWLNLDEARGVAPGSGGGVQDLCWVHHASGWLLASIHGPSLLCIWETSNNPRVLWMFDAAPEYLSCGERGLHPAAPPRHRPRGPLLPHVQRGADVRAGGAPEHLDVRAVGPPGDPDHVQQQRVGLVRLGLGRRRRLLRRGRGLHPQPRRRRRPGLRPAHRLRRRQGAQPTPPDQPEPGEERGLRGGSLHPPGDQVGRADPVAGGGRPLAAPGVDGGVTQGIEVRRRRELRGAPGAARRGAAGGEGGRRWRVVEAYAGRESVKVAYESEGKGGTHEDRLLQLVLQQM